MSDIEFPSSWPAKHSDQIQLYSFATPNGVKASIMLEEIGLPYDAHLIHIGKDDQFKEDFIKINPNSKIPAIIDPNGPNNQPIAFMESGAILMYLAEKTNQLLSKDPETRWQTLQWLFFQVGHIGPMFGQFGHFYMYAKDKTDNYGEERYTKEAIRLLSVLNDQLDKNEFISGTEYSIADIAIYGWTTAFDFYQGKDAVRFQEYTHLHRWQKLVGERPAVKRGLEVCKP